MKLRGCRAKGMTERRATGRRLHARVSEGRVGIVRAVGLKGRIVTQTPRLDLGRGGLAACKCPEQDSDPRGQTLVPATAAGSLPPPGGGHASGETPLPTTTTDGQRRAPPGAAEPAAVPRPGRTRTGAESSVPAGQIRDSIPSNILLHACTRLRLRASLGEFPDVASLGQRISTLVRP